MRFAIVFSVLLHVGAFMVAYIALPDFRSNPLVDIIVPIEVLREAEIDDETSVPESITEPEPEEQPVSEPEPAAIEPEPELELEPEPEEVVPPLPEPLIEEQEPVIEEQPTPEPKPKRDELDLDALGSLLTDLDPDKNVAAPRQAPSETPIAERNQDRVGLGERLTASEYSKVQAHLRACWNPQSFIGAPNAEKLRVEIEFNLNRDGSLLGQPRVSNQSQIRSSGNRFWLVAEREALNAILKCEPYDFLEQDRYDVWREFKFNFDPGVMAGF